MTNMRIVNRVVTFMLSLLVIHTVYGAETWHLENGSQWKQVQDETQNSFLLAVGKIKEFINNGEVKQVQQAYAELKEDFPEIRGPDFDAFIEAELLYAKGKFGKAVRAYDEFLNTYPESELYQVALDRQFFIAQAYLAGQKRKVLKVFRISGYSEGVKIMDGISDRAGNAPLAERANFAVAESFEKRQKYEDAYQRWSQILSTWPTGQTGKNALLGLARCKYLAYNGPKYDVSDLVSAKTYYENFQTRYPEDAKELGIDGKVQNINELLAEKQFKIGQFYEKTNNYKSAKMYYRTIVEQWPTTTAAKISQTLIKKLNEQGVEEGND